ncbi:MAG TPA: hypothetical protein VE525_06715 [Rubrobacter sp.]|nr:hypothetical protein [Rubrobacter sp.]
MLVAAPGYHKLVEAGHLFGDVPALAGRVRRGPDPSRVVILTIPLLHHR